MIPPSQTRRAHARVDSRVRPELRGRDSQETKSRLLEAAERLFAERGFEGTSMRAVTHEAGVSVSAANYHFGSKEALLRETLGLVIEPVNAARLARLDALEREAAPRAPGLDAVLEAFLRPAIELRDDASLGRHRYRQLAARLFSDPPELVASLKQQHFGPLVERFGDALRRALPDRDPGELLMAFEFAIGMMVHVIAGQMDLHSHRPAGQAVLPEANELLARMIRFASAGLRTVPRRTSEAAGSESEPGSGTGEGGRR